MLSSYFSFRDIYLDQQDDLLKTFLSVKLFTASTSAFSVAYPKAIMKLTIVGILDASLNSQPSIMFCVGSILHLFGISCLNFRFDSYMLRYKAYN